MRLHVAFLVSILAFADSHMVEMAMDKENRFLADRTATKSELATHKTYAAGLWTSLGGIVYDVTNFSHPGGTKILLVGGIEGDALYTTAIKNGDHPFTIAQVVSRPGIVRIGPLQSNPAPTTTAAPTRVPTKRPTPGSATKAPTRVPTKSPTLVTTTKSPTHIPTNSPTLGTTTKSPTSAPTKSHTSGTATPRE